MLSPLITQNVVLRLATDVDAPTVRRLAALDDAPPLSGRVLLAFVDGEPVAALSLDDGRVVADPFRLTAHEVTLLRLHAEHLTAPRSEIHEARAWRRWRRRLGPGVLQPRAA